MFPPVARYKYPHMLPADVEIWERFLAKHADEFLGYDYDVHVGGAVDVLPWWSETDIRMASTLAAKRIDVVGYKADEIWLIEVKPEAGVTAVGQLVMYQELYIEQYKPKVPVVCCLVCENVMPDERKVIEKLGFRVITV